MIRFKVYDENGLPLAACKTYKEAEKARIAYLNRTNKSAYIVDIFAQVTMVNGLIQSVK